MRHVVTRELRVWPESADGDYPTVGSITTLLAAVHDRSETYLSTLDERDLDCRVVTPWREELSPRSIVWHVLEHEIHYRGEIYLMLGLMGMKAPGV